MPVLWFMEYDIPEDEDARQKYLGYIFDEEYSCMVMDRCKELDAKLNVWVDDADHIVYTIEFGTEQDYEKLFGDPAWQAGLAKLKRLVLNANTRLMRPAGE